MDPSSDVVVEIRNWELGSALLEVLKVGMFQLFPVSTFNFKISMNKGGIGCE